MQRDIRATERYQEIEALYTALRQPGTGQITDATEICVSSDGRYAVFAGTLTDTLEGLPPTRICLTDLATADTRVLTYGPNTDRLPRLSPDAEHVAFLSDRHEAGNFQLYLLDLRSGAARQTPSVEGWVEYLHWSPDGKRILLCVAGHGADVAGGQGAVTSKRADSDLRHWMPEVSPGQESYRWRRAWLYELETHSVRAVATADTNIWEAVWCGNGALAAVISPGPEEGLWYSAQLQLIDVASGSRRELYRPHAQIGWPAASPSGGHLAVVHAICSDRWIVAGDLMLIDTLSGRAERVDTAGVDVSHTEWRSDNRLLLAGHRGFETVVGLYDVAAGTFAELWSSVEMSSGGRYIKVSGFGASGDCVLLGESFQHAPEIALIHGGAYRVVRSLNPSYREQLSPIRAVERVTWKARDGLDIQGWLLLPEGEAAHALIMNVHGGPVWAWRPLWPGRTAVVLALVRQGYAVFLPNPRGSTGRGQAFVQHVYGDMGGADAQDLLTGLDALIERGIADPKRIGVMGGSYGGFMTAWLITQDRRFAAAVPASPHTNQVTEHLLSNIPHFMALLLNDTYNNPTGRYFERSPVMHAHKVKTPTLNVCGALDRCTPPEEALQFHNALLEHGAKSVLITYPQEGHGVRNFPAAIDYATRVVSWFEEHMPARTR